MRTELPSVKVSDGTEMLLFVARPLKLPAPAVMVFPEVFGVTHHIREVVHRLALDGYLAAAPELFHRTAKRGFEGSYDDVSTVMPHVDAMTQDGLEADIRATYQWLKQDQSTQGGRVGALGFGMGGRAAFLANAYLPLRATASYYGLKIVPDLLALSAVQHGPLLLFTGGKDQSIGRKSTQVLGEALRKAQKTVVEVEFSDADHSFFCEERFNFTLKPRSNPGRV